MDNALLQPVTTGPLAPYIQQTRRVEAIVIGESRDQVYRLWDDQAPIGFLKVGSRQSLAPLAADAARLEWLADRLPVPRLLGYQETADACYLLMGVIPGTDTATLSQQAGIDLEPVVRLLAAGLRQVHAVPIVDCPFDACLARQIEQVQFRLARGLVNADVIGGPWAGRPIPDLFAELLATIPPVEDLVLTHGDYCLPNILLEGDQVSGFVDLGRVGVADRYRDLALVQRSLIRNCGPAWVPYFFAEYGLPQPDEAKLTFYQLLDEFY
ncbi:MAG: aminoglycoside 3'-phosphotransferase [Caldilineaceae bacterium]|nr:aminoglycoside 3'-phosphotransferase [Caldilineaceae bacterium]